MAVNGGPKIPKDGLVLSLDAANSKSFRGEPATNILPVTSDNIYNILNTANSTYGPLSIISTSTPYGTKAHQLTFKANADNGFYSTNTCRFTSQAVTVQRDGVTKYSYSVWVYVLNERWDEWNSLVVKYVTGTNGWSGMSDLGQRKKDSQGRVWRRYGYKGQTSSGGGTGGEYHAFYKNGTLASDLIVLLSAPDFYERNDNILPVFVNGTRGTTVATGGGWADITNNSNHGELLNGTAYDSGSLGSLSFDGVNDRVNFYFSNSTVRCYNSSVIFIVKIPTWSGGQKCILSYRSGNGGQLYIGKKNGGIFSYYNSLQSGGTFAAGTTHTSTGDFNNNSVVFGAVVMDTDNGLFKTYVNGKKIGEVVRDGGWVSNYNTVLNLGYDAGGTNEYMIGNFYYFAHYNRVLSQNEIKNIYEATRGRFGL